MTRSRLRCRCCRCQYDGPRDEFYRLLPGQMPGFIDVCPRSGCGSTNVEVYDPVVARQIQKQNDDREMHQAFKGKRAVA